MLLECAHRQQDISPIRQFAYSLDSPPTRFHVVYALIQLYIYSKKSMLTTDMTAVRIAGWLFYQNSRMAILTVAVIKVRSRDVHIRKF